MSIGSGLAGSFGYAAESTYGTYVAPTKFLEFDKESFSKKKTIVQGGGLAGGRGVQLGSRRVVSVVEGNGSIDLEVANKGMGLLFQNLLGGTPTVVQQATTAAWLQTHTLGDNVGKSLTCQVGVPDTTGTIRPYSFLGGKVLSAAFSCGVKGILNSTWEFDFQNVSEIQVLAAPSYATGLAPFHGGQLAVKIGTFGSEAAITGVTKVDVKFERPQNTDRFYANAAGAPGTKSEPLWSDFFKISGSLEQDFTDKTSLADKFAADTSTSLILEWVGPTIASTFKETFRIKLPMTFFDSGTPDVSDTDITNTKYAFTAQYDGTNSAATIEYMSTDTTV